MVAKPSWNIPYLAHLRLRVTSELATPDLRQLVHESLVQTPWLDIDKPNPLTLEEKPSAMLPTGWSVCRHGQQDFEACTMLYHKQFYPFHKYSIELARALREKIGKSEPAFKISWVYSLESCTMW